jgi:hypothetical protein
MHMYIGSATARGGGERGCIESSVAAIARALLQLLRGSDAAVACEALLQLLRGSVAAIDMRAAYVALMLERCEVFGFRV